MAYGLQGLLTTHLTSIVAIMRGQIYLIYLTVHKNINKSLTPLTHIHRHFYLFLNEINSHQ